MNHTGKTNKQRNEKLKNETKKANTNGNFVKVLAKL